MLKTAACCIDVGWQNRALVENNFWKPDQSFFFKTDVFCYWYTQFWENFEEFYFGLLKKFVWVFSRVLLLIDCPPESLHCNMPSFLTNIYQFFECFLKSSFYKTHRPIIKLYCSYRIDIFEQQNILNYILSCSHVYFSRWNRPLAHWNIWHNNDYPFVNKTK